MDKKKKTIVGLVVLLGFLLTFGYSTFAQPLAYPGRMITNNWNISFTDVKVDEIVGDAKEISGADFNGTTATFNVSLSSLGDKITYDFVITNKGTMEAKVDGIFIKPENKASDAIVFNTSGLKVGDVLEPGESTHVKVSALFVGKSNITSEETQKSVNVLINYVQN